MKHAIKHIHFVGVGGSGMSGIAEIGQQPGLTVSGSGPERQPAAAALGRLGIRRSSVTMPSRSRARVRWAPQRQSAAATGSHRRARRAHSRVPRARCCRIERLKRGIAIAGTNGQNDDDLAGGQCARRSRQLTPPCYRRTAQQRGCELRLGAGEYTWSEAEESDASLLNLKPCFGGTNIDADHMDTTATTMRG